MFSLKKRNITIFLTIATLMLLANVGMAQTAWEKYPGNPVLDLGPIAWDDCGVYAPTILFDGSIYHMWYAGYDCLNHRIGYAYSIDGIEWTKHPKPVLDLGPSLWDDYGVSHPTVLFDGDKYHMWYTGYDGSTNRIGYATSPDPINWKKHPNNPVLDIGPKIWDSYWVQSPTVFFDGIEYHMWYAGLDGTNYRIGYAKSADPINWKKHPNNPVLDLGASGEWDDYGVGYPTVLFDGDNYRMWYNGYDASNWRIGYATESCTGSINGIVTDADTGKPIEKAFVIAIKESWALTRPDGSYEITDLKPDIYLLIAIKKGYKAGFAKITVECDKTTTQDFELKPESGESNEDEFLALSNFPNPFNPDTWIPYYLPQNANVTIQIYNSAGQLIRTLNLGRQSAGIYLDKDKAAYWDGRNNFGQQVASGVYFYTLQAGDFRATRKMTILK